MSQDLSSKPSQGRFFPHTFEVVSACVVELGFAVHFQGARLAVRFQNCDVECELGFQVATFMRMSYLAVFSLPDSVARSVAEAALDLSIAEFASIDRGPHLAVREQQFVVYRAYLGPLGNVSLAQHVVSAGSRSYLQFQRAAMLSRSQRKPEHHRVLLARRVA